MLIRTTIGLAALLIVPLGACAQKTGSPSADVPPNPFASNYPSGSPPGSIVEQRRRRQVIRRTDPGPQSDPIPPGRLPQ